MVNDRALSGKGSEKDSDESPKKNQRFLGVSTHFDTKYVQLCKCQNEKKLIKICEFKNCVKMGCMHHLRKQIFPSYKVCARFCVKHKPLAKFSIFHISKLPFLREFH